MNPWTHEVKQQVGDFHLSQKDIILLLSFLQFLKEKHFHCKIHNTFFFLLLFNGDIWIESPTEHGNKKETITQEEQAGVLRVMGTYYFSL